jgi:hypothetical protein
MTNCRSNKVQRIVALRVRAAKLSADYARAEAKFAPLRHRARQHLEEARVLKGTLTAFELAQLRRAWSGA